MNKAEEAQKQEAGILMGKAVAEIKTLRTQNQVQAARLQMFDDIKMMLHVEVPRSGMSHTPDICEDIAQHLKAAK